MRNTLVLNNLARSNQGEKISCKAVNTNLTSPLSTTVSISMVCKYPHHLSLFHTFIPFINAQLLCFLMWRQFFLTLQIWIVKLLTVAILNDVVWVCDSTNNVGQFLLYPTVIKVALYSKVFAIYYKYMRLKSLKHIRSAVTTYIFFDRLMVSAYALQNSKRPSK